MRSDVAFDMEWSSKAFVDVVWPRIRHWFGESDVIPVETVTEAAFAKQLDIDAGVDFWVVRKNKGLTPVASRIQLIKPGAMPYNSFTIRASRPKGKETEMHKRLRAIRESDRGYLYPHVTIQAFLKKADLTFMSVAGVLTKDLYCHIDQYSINRARNGGETFKIAYWAQLRKLGAKIKTIPD